MRIMSSQPLVKALQPKEKEKKPDGIKKSNLPQADRFMPSVKAKNLTYSNPVNRANQSSVAKLRAESEKSFEMLKRFVDQLLLRQGNFALGVDGMNNLMMDKADQAEAAELIADNGPLGPEAVSERIVRFAKSVAGNDPSKIGVLRDAIKEGFSQAENVLGKLPEVSVRTLDLVMQKLDQWEKPLP